MRMSACASLFSYIVRADAARFALMFSSQRRGMCDSSRHKLQYTHTNTNCIHTHKSLNRSLHAEENLLRIGIFTILEAGRLHKMIGKEISKNLSNPLEQHPELFWATALNKNEL